MRTFESVKAMISEYASLFGVFGLRKESRKRGAIRRHSQARWKGEGALCTIPTCGMWMLGGGRILLDGVPATAGRRADTRANAI